MQGSEKQRGLFDVDQIAPGLVPRQSIYGFLAANRRLLFPEGEFADLFPSVRGRPSIPGSVAATALLLQALEVRTDREAAEALTFDLRWKAACGLPVDGRSFHFSVFSVWRARIAASDTPDRVFAAVAKVVAECGVLKGRRARAVDSTILDDAVARQDAVTLLARQIRVVARVVPLWAGRIAVLPGAKWHVGATGLGKADIDWGDEAAKDRLVSELVEDALVILGWDRGGLDEAQLDQVGLLGVLAGQDVEPAEGSDGTDGRWRIAQKVAVDRVISTVDPDARHARKTRGTKRDGFKAHVVVEPDTGIITVSRLTKAAGDGTGDGRVGCELVKQDPGVQAGGVGQVLADSAYSSRAMLEVCDEVGVVPLIKPKVVVPPVEGGFTVDDFLLDDLYDPSVVTCPGGQVKRFPASGQVKFTACGACSLRSRCTKSMARTFKVSVEALVQRRHRLRVGVMGDGFTVPYRTKRPMVERSIAWLFRKARRVPYRGVDRNDAWLSLRAGAVNLKRLMTMGLGCGPAGWVLNPVT